MNLRAFRPACGSCRDQAGGGSIRSEVSSGRLALPSAQLISPHQGSQGRVHRTTQGRRVTRCHASVLWAEREMPTLDSESCNNPEQLLDDRRQGSDPEQAGASKVVVEFKVPYHCDYGQRVLVVGSGANLGGWDVAQAAEMHWTSGDVWTIKLELEEMYDHLEYKYVIRNPDGEVVAWKPGANCQLELQEATQVEVSDSWCGSMHDVKSEAGALATAAATLHDEAYDFTGVVEWAFASSLEKLKCAVDASVALMNQSDPADPELIAADKILHDWARHCYAEYNIPHSSRIITP